MAPLVPDVPYGIQALFIATFGFIWTVAFNDDYNDPLPEIESEATRITVSGLYLISNRHKTL